MSGFGKQGMSSDGQATWLLWCFLWPLQSLQRCPVIHLCHSTTTTLRGLWSALLFRSALCYSVSESLGSHLAPTILV